jgi:nicotinamide mononucleotide transporter
VGQEGSEQPIEIRRAIVSVVLTKTVFEVFGEPVSWAELFGFITGIACVALAVAQRIETFPVGIANNVFFVILFTDARLYADAALQIVYIALGVMGWIAWSKLKGQALSVSRAGPRLLVGTAVGVAVATVILIPILRAAHGAAPGWDALTTSMSLGAQLLLNLKRLETWYVWIAVDVIYVPLYLSRDLNLTALVYVVFLALCIQGWRQWRVAV